MRKSVGFGAVAAALVVGLFYVATSAGSQSTGGAIRLYEHDTTQASFARSPTGPSVGDQFVFAGDVFNHKGGKKLGRAGGSCLTVSGGEAVCAVNITLPGGQLAYQSMFNSAKLFGGKALAFPITGGTGIYRNARGQGTVRVPTNVPNQADAYFVIRLD